MPNFISRSYKIERLQTGPSDNDFQLALRAFEKPDWTGKEASMQIVMKGQDDTLVSEVLDALARGWPDKTITFKVTTRRRITGVTSVP